MLASTGRDLQGGLGGGSGVRWRLLRILNLVFAYKYRIDMPLGSWRQDLTPLL
jgi:hypothetical protein